MSDPTRPATTIRCPACHSDNVECDPKPHMHSCLDCGYDGTTTESDLGARLRSQANISTRPGQLTELNRMATEADRLVAEVERLQAELGDIETFLAETPECGWQSAALVWRDRAETAEAEVERLRALVAERDNPTSNDDLFDFVGTWHVCHADGTTEDIVLTHGNLVEDNRGTCGQFILTRRVVAGPQEPDTCRIGETGSVSHAWDCRHDDTCPAKNDPRSAPGQRDSGVWRPRSNASKPSTSNSTTRSTGFVPPFPGGAFHDD